MLPTLFEAYTQVTQLKAGMKDFQLFLSDLFTNSGEGAVYEYVCKKESAAQNEKDYIHLDGADAILIVSSHAEPALALHSNSSTHFYLLVWAHEDIFCEFHQGKNYIIK